MKRRYFSKSLAVALILAMTLAMLGVTGSASGTVPFNGQPKYVWGPSPVPGQGPAYPGHTAGNWVKWNVGNAGEDMKKNGTTYQFSYIPENCNPEDLVVYVKAGSRPIIYGTVSSGGSVHLTDGVISFNITFTIINGTWVFTVQDTGTLKNRPALSNWGFLCQAGDGNGGDDYGYLTVSKVVYQGDTVLEEDDGIFALVVNEVYGSNAYSGTVAAGGPTTFVLAPGNYSVDESQLPPGYEYVSGAGIVNIAAGETVYVTIVNNKIDVQENGTLVVEKVLEGDGADPGQLFDIIIEDTDGNEVASGQVSANEPATFTLPAGDYTVEEALPIGYTLVSISPSTVTVPAGGEVTVTITNRYNYDDEDAQESGTVIVSKVIQNGGNPNLNFTITFTPEEGEPISGTISVNSSPKTFTLPVGTYTISETVPAGYTLVSINPATITVTAETETTVTITNSFNTTTIIDDFTPTTTTTPATTDEEGAEEEIVIAPEEPAVQDELQDDVQEIELLPELPKTSGADILFLGLGMLAAAGGLVARRRRK